MLNPTGYSASALGNYFADRNSSKIGSISERVSKTGVYSEDDIQAFIKKNQIGKWFTSDAEDAADRESAIRQLQQYASYKSIHDRAAARGFTPYTDAANGITRDAAGNPIKNNPEDPTNKLIAINEEIRDATIEGNKQAKERSEAQLAAENFRTRASVRFEEVSAAARSPF
jgi:hypothetical protein